MVGTRNNSKHENRVVGATTAGTDKAEALNS